MILTLGTAKPFQVSPVKPVDYLLVLGPRRVIYHPSGAGERIGSNPCGSGFWIHSTRGFWRAVQTTRKSASLSVPSERTPQCETRLFRSHLVPPPHNPPPPPPCIRPTRPAARQGPAAHSPSLRRKFQFVTLPGIEPGLT